MAHSFFTARCYTERGIGTHNRPFVRLWRWGTVITYVGILQQ